MEIRDAINTWAQHRIAAATHTPTEDVTILNVDINNGDYENGSGVQIHYKIAGHRDAPTVTVDASLADIVNDVLSR